MRRGAVYAWAAGFVDKDICDEVPASLTNEGLGLPGCVSID